MNDPKRGAEFGSLRRLSRAQSRLVDQVAIEEFGFTGLMLMENAAAGAARCLASRYQAQSGAVLLVCGGGNNGGDGLAMARHLANMGIPIGVLLAADPLQLSHDCAVQWNIVRRMSVPTQVWPNEANGAETDAGFPIAVSRLVESVGKLGWVVDALLGTGAAGPVRPPYAAIVQHLNGWTHVQRWALDLPTGWDCDQGLRYAPVFRADLTYTFVAMKQSFSHPATSEYVGEIVIGDIGIPPEVLARVESLES